jgi:putative membrane protein
MTPIACRGVLLFALAVVPAAYASRALAVDALPDARFVGFAQQHNDFEIASAKLALSKSNDENVRGYANRMLAVHDLAAQHLAKSRSEAGVSYAPDPNSPGRAVAAGLARRPAVRHRLCKRPARGDDQCRGAVRRLLAGRPRRPAAPLRAGGVSHKIRLHLEYAQRLAGGL